MSSSELYEKYDKMWLQFCLIETQQISLKTDSMSQVSSGPEKWESEGWAVFESRFFCSDFEPFFIPSYAIYFFFKLRHPNRVVAWKNQIKNKYTEHVALIKWDICFIF